jgi:hypothetical protein
MAGDPHCTGELCPAIYICRRTDGTILSLHTIPTRNDGCDTSSGQGYGMTVYSAGQCWEGASPGMGMGAQSAAAVITTADPCRGRVIPRIVLGVSVGTNGLGGYLSSDVTAGTTKSSPGSTGHFDYVLGWKRTALSNVIRDCLNTTTFTLGEASCAAVTSGTRRTIYQVRPRGEPGFHPICVTGPGCNRRRPRLAIGAAIHDVAVIGDLIEKLSLRGAQSARRHVVA